MSGLTFFGTAMPDEIVEFYTEKLGMEIWLEQSGCTILKHGNLLLGFCESERPDVQGTITFFYPDREDVDEMHEKFADIAITELKENERYRIYNFFAKDPEGRSIEFQTFLHPLGPHMEGIEVLRTRRSIRKFEDKEVSAPILDKIFDTCRYSPTSKNTPSYYFVPIHDSGIRKALAAERGGASEPIENAPMAVAICSDPYVSKRHVQDAVIAGYHFMLTAWAHGLGTCWIADMDRDMVKDRLRVPREHYIATVTPLGYPEETMIAPKRKDLEDYLK